LELALAECGFSHACFVGIVHLRN